MATVYTVSLGEVWIQPDGIHAGMEHFVTWFKLLLIDGESDWDRWILEENRVGSSWPKNGEWLRVSSSTNLTLFTAESGSRLATLKSGRWPWRRGSSGDIELWREVSGKKKGTYYVDRVE